MPYFLLQITAQLENIAQLEPNNGVDDEEMRYFFTVILIALLLIQFLSKLKCENCGEVSKEVCTHASAWDTHKGEYANLVLECQGCERIGTVNLICGHGAPLTQELANGLKYAPLMLFRCDGLIPHCYEFNGGWKVTLNSGAEIWDCNLFGGNFNADDEWVGEDKEMGKHGKDDEEGDEERKMMAVPALVAQGSSTLEAGSSSIGCDLISSRLLHVVVSHVSGRKRVWCESSCKLCRVRENGGRSAASAG